ncbi:selenoprotein H-like [Sesamum indicum]|uniref:Selenoprotein H-like n=1 Tax=Sesamum indicum TaxID=4182 RepID=A0A6I9SWV8_SESIN|nr:selenoprotein H-like [Sesamum indicum]
MAPKRKQRKGNDGASTSAAATTSSPTTRAAQRSANRATRSATSRGAATLRPPVANPEPRKKRKNKAFTSASTSLSSAAKTVIIEHSTQSNTFKKIANKVKIALKKELAGMKVVLNPEKPRKGCFQIREEGGEVFVSLLDMVGPFEQLKALDVNATVAEIVGKIG